MTVAILQTDARVQAITESVGILRMVKLFGWVSKMMKRVEDRRAEELNWLWKIKVRCQSLHPSGKSSHFSYAPRRTGLPYKLSGM